MRAKKDNIADWYRDVPLSAKWPIFTGLAILIVWLGCFGVWAGVAPLNGAVVVTLRPALLNSVDKVLILRAGRAEAFGSPSDVLHRLVRSTGGAPGDKTERPRRIESSGP